MPTPERMVGEVPLFRLAVDAGTISMHHRQGYGWDLTTIFRRNGETWAEADRCCYSCLTTDELVDVLNAVVNVELTGPG